VLHLFQSQARLIDYFIFRLLHGPPKPLASFSFCREQKQQKQVGQKILAGEISPVEGKAMMHK